MKFDPIVRKHVEFREEMLAIGPHSHALHPVKACERIARYPL